ncbi:MAG: 4-hydroxy-tetrahydrodipicolinate reductase [Spirochaetaceae bacterium]|jgi:4-hydroxy-tetrahydrodipicolinate reductase|nr:4-hydroxy-tetrahydrodipicolinate reductase [Spirochaetaceae bacterium]
MHIVIAGYGKMGHLIEKTAVQMGHTIVCTIDPVAADARVPGADEAIRQGIFAAADGIIEFSHPSAVVENIRALLPLGIPMVVGTTGWKEREGEIASLAARCGGTLVRSANFSLGVNLFYRIVEEAARLIGRFSEYDAAVWENHHNQKADSPSGTAAAIAERIIAAGGAKKRVVSGNFPEKPEPEALQIASTRVGHVPGTHSVFFDSPADTIELTHTARNREGFALGAVHALALLAAALFEGRLVRGRLYGMDDLF